MVTDEQRFPLNIHVFMWDVCVRWQCLLLHLPDDPKQGKSWKDAQSICSSFEGSLVAIEDEIEQGTGKKNKTSTDNYSAVFVDMSDIHHFVSYLQPISPCCSRAALWGCGLASELVT